MRLKTFGAPKEIHIWVDGNGGDDSNDGLTPETPKRTFDGAVPPKIFTNTICHLRGTFNVGLDKLLPQVQYGQVVIFDGAEAPWKKESKMSQDIRKLQEYKGLKESLDKVWAVMNEDGDIEIYETKELAEEANRDYDAQGYQASYIQELPIKNTAFCQLHREIFPTNKEKINTLTETDFDFEDEDKDEECCCGDCDECNDDDSSYVPVAPKPTTADIQSRLKDLAKFKSAMPQKQPATVVTVKPVQPAVGVNNDGRLVCYACGEPTKIVDTGFSKYYVCTACGK